MIQKTTGFIKGEDGAVTVDWVVLTAAILLLTIAAFVNIRNGSGAMGDRIGTYLADTDPADLRPPLN